MMHELGHHRNRDLVLYTAIAELIFALCNLFGLMIPHSVYGITIPIFLLVSPFFFLGIFSIVRWREGMEDDFARRNLKDSTGLGSFLSKVVKEKSDSGVYIPVNPSWIIRISDAHPWIFDRIKRFS
jgi:Zn-dependent protease with chaperone function